MHRCGRPGMLLAVLGTLASLMLPGGPGRAWAQANIEVGPFRILPSLEVKGEYDDNILLAPRDEIDDFIWTISPGITVELPGRRSALRLGYRADVVEYTENSDLDTVEHTGQFEGRITLGIGLDLYLTDEFRRTQDFPGFPVPELTEIADRNENTLAAGGEYRVSERVSLGADYRWYLVDYDSGAEFEQFDRQDHQFRVTGYYRFQPKTAVLGEYRYQMIRYDDEPVAKDRDSDSHALLVGVRGDVTAKTSLQLKVGYESRDYDNPAREDFEGLIVEGEAVWKYAEPSQLRLYAGRAPVESTFEGQNYYDAIYGGLELRHYLTPLLILQVNGLFGVADYPESTELPGGGTRTRSDDYWEIGAGLRYQVRRWLAVVVDYAYRTRNSNFEDFEYSNNRVSAAIRLTY